MLYRLYFKIEKTNSKFHIFNGAVSRKPLKFIPNGLSSHTVVSKEADCKGFIIQFSQENDIGEFRIIILEKDYPKSYDAEFESYLIHKGFIVFPLGLSHVILWLFM
ncbi:MAG: hypothetical protein QXW79_01145 [Thermoplasmata archaeon]